MIDVRELARTLTDAELLEAADAYFAGLDVDSEQCHKPFSNIGDAVHLHRNLSLVLQAADLFRGADVLDFGCATGWLTLALASLGCEVRGIDVAPSAIALANAWKERRGVRPGGRATFLAYEGRTLPLADASVDRIVCFDAFHHVKDQAGTIREFARVLRPGGRIAMLEPGPNHSRTPQSQREMSMYKVIENDIDMREIRAHARAAGLESPAMLVQMAVPIEVAAEEFIRWSEAVALPGVESHRFASTLKRQLTDTQCFYIRKPGTVEIDSRTASSLAAELRFISAEPLGANSVGWNFRLAARNVGEGTWRTEPGVVGVVNLGLQLFDAGGRLAERDFWRVPIGGEPVRPGEERLLEFVVHTGVPPGCHIVFDLVSELVSWFGDIGRSTLPAWSPAAGLLDAGPGL
jgi:SAM-dependent methyltransferase